MGMDSKASVNVTINRMRRHETALVETDSVVVEEPLEIRVEGRSIAVIMRTPGHDEELAAGFLVSEGIIRTARDVFEISVCPSNDEGRGNVVDVLLTDVQVDWDKLTRHVFASSSCGLCGKTAMDSVFQHFTATTDRWTINEERLLALPEKLRATQATFDQTGGLHACALFDLEGHLIVAREDVGRHNALDKVLGYGLRNGLLPYAKNVLLLSGRVSFEMMQKALAGGVPLVAAISAPSSLAVSFAEESQQTLIGFLRGDRMNVYSHPQRITRSA